MARSCFKDICIGSLTVVYIFCITALVATTNLSADKENKLNVIRTSIAVIVFCCTLLLFLVLASAPILKLLNYASEDEAEETSGPAGGGGDDDRREVVIDIDSAVAVGETCLKQNCEIHEVSEDESSEECCICLAGSGEDNVWVILKNCKHIFHYKCLCVWLASTVSCPICRDPITQK